MRRALALLVVMAFLVAGCSSGESGTASATVEPLDAVPASSTTVTTAVPPSTTTSTTPVAIEITAEGPIGAATRLSLELINGEPIDEVTYGQVFGAAAQQQLPHPLFVATMDQLAAAGPWILVEEIGVSPDGYVGIVVDDGGERFRLTVQIADANALVIETLLIQPAFVQPVSAEEAIQRLASLGSFRFLAAELTQGECSPLTFDGADEMMPLGSVFKLYVLAALVEAEGAGQLSWDEGVVIRDELDSLPSGTTQNEPPGSTLTVRELAERMISISDNTATDHLIEVVGRDAVEAAVVRSGHSDPSVNAPFLTTRELFILKFSAGSVLLADYLEADEAGRRAMLENEVAAANLPDVSAVGSRPVAVDSVEWFATPNDLCLVLSSLAESDDGRAVMAINPGVPDSADRWTYIGFKGGSEPGVAAAAWLLEDENGSQYVFAGGIANGSVTFDANDAVRLMAVLRDEYAVS